MFKAIICLYCLFRIRNCYENITINQTNIQMIYFCYYIRNGCWRRRHIHTPICSTILIISIKTIRSFNNTLHTLINRFNPFSCIFFLYFILYTFNHHSNIFTTFTNLSICRLTKNIQLVSLYS